jgi:hypothetical protein
MNKDNRYCPFLPKKKLWASELCSRASCLSCLPLPDSLTDVTSYYRHGLIVEQHAIGEQTVLIDSVLSYHKTDP